MASADRIVAKITRASKEQETGVAQITSGIHEMDKTIEASAVQTEENAAAAQVFQRQVLLLRQSIQALPNVAEGHHTAEAAWVKS